MNTDELVSLLATGSEREGCEVSRSLRHAGVTKPEIGFDRVIWRLESKGTGARQASRANADRTWSAWVRTNRLKAPKTLSR